jgi:hypothetical protein
MQVNFLPLAVAVDPALVHFAPALTAANEGAVISEIERTKPTRIRARVMAIRYQSTISSLIERWSMFGHGEPRTKARSFTLDS